MLKHRDIYNEKERETTKQMETWNFISFYVERLIEEEAVAFKASENLKSVHEDVFFSEDTNEWESQWGKSANRDMEICNLCECTCWNSWVIARVVDTEEEEIYHMACLSTFTDRSGSIFSEKKKRGKKWEVSFHYRFCLEELQSILQQYQQHIHIQQETIMEVVPPTKLPPPRPEEQLTVVEVSPTTKLLSLETNTQVVASESTMMEMLEAAFETTQK